MTAPDQSLHRDTHSPVEGMRPVGDVLAGVLAQIVEAFHKREDERARD